MKEILSKTHGSSLALHNSLEEEAMDLDSTNYYLQRSSSSSLESNENDKQNIMNSVNNANTNISAGVVPSNVVAIIAIEPTLDESKNYGLKDSYDSEISTDGSEVIITTPQNRTKLWPQVIEFSVIFVRVYSNHKLHL